MIVSTPLTAARYLFEAFRGYYRFNLSQIRLPKDIIPREFAFFPFNANYVNRHIGFADHNSVVRYLQQNPPRHAYYSSAYFKYPDAERMQEKQWEGADLVFDIDADHFDIPCRDSHDSWTCTSCGCRGLGSSPPKCPDCSTPNSRIKSFAWLCENCLVEAKHETIKLIEDFLEPDFGFSKKQMQIVFSGHRGYHVHVHDTAFNLLGSSERREIIDYVTGNGIDPVLHGLEETYGRPKRIKGPSGEDHGWRGRLARGLIGYLTQVDEKHLQQITSMKRKVAYILKHRDRIISGISSSPPKYNYPKLKITDWHALAKQSAYWIGSKIDVAVTGDVHRLIRLPETLHGKTGFRVVPLTYIELTKFDPFKDALVFKGTITIHVTKAPAFRIADNEYPAYTDTILDVPTNTGVFLLAKGVADFQGL